MCVCVCLNIYIYIYQCVCACAYVCVCLSTFTFMHLADAFIQRDLQYIQVIQLYCQYVCSLGIEPTTFALLTQCSTTEPQELHIYILVCVCVCV